MKLFQIMKDVKNKLTIFLYLFVLINGFSQDCTDIRVFSEVECYSFLSKEYAVISIDYVNNTSQPIALWIQNWKISHLSKQNRNKICYNLNGGQVNDLLFLENNVDTVNFYKSITHYINNDTLLNCNFFKLINANEKFRVNIISTDSMFIEMLKKNNYSILLNTSYVREINKSNFQENIFLDKHQLYIYFDDLQKMLCYTHNITGESGINTVNDYNYLIRMLDLLSCSSQVEKK